MSKKNYEKFLFKIDQLNKLVRKIEESPEKYKLFVNCETHNEIVEMAKEWGFEIGSRWGE